MDPARLADLEEIKQLKARYFRFLDGKQWDDFGEVFSKDAVSRSPDDPHKIMMSGRAGIVERVKGVVRDAITVHHGHMPEITFTSPTSATGLWLMFGWVDFGTHGWKGYGHYHEEYVKEGGRWYIKSFRLTRIRLDRFGKEPG